MPQRRTSLSFRNRYDSYQPRLGKQSFYRYPRHLTGPTSQVSAGADHFNVDMTGWTIMPGSAGPLTFFVTSGTMTFTGTVPRGPPITVPISPTPLDTGFPAVPGHFSTSMILGFTPPPGVTFVIQVVQLTH